MRGVADKTVNQKKKRKLVNKMGDKNIKKEAKKPKKSDKKPMSATVSTTPKLVMTQPELIKKVKKPK